MIIGGKPTNPGALRTRLTLLSRSIVTASGGFQTVRYTTVATVWGSWTNVHGQEAWAAYTEQADQAATVQIRYRADVDCTLAVVKGAHTVTNVPGSTFAGGVFEVISFDNIKERGEMIELKIKRVREG